MLRSIPSILLLMLLITLGSCSGSKSFYKKGQKLDESGLRLEAANFYIESLKRKNSNADAIIALKKTGQFVLDDKGCVCISVWGLPATEGDAERCLSAAIQIHQKLKENGNIESWQGMTSGRVFAGIVSG